MRNVPALVRTLSTTPVLLGPTTVDRFIFKGNRWGLGSRISSKRSSINLNRSQLEDVPDLAATEEVVMDKRLQ